MFQFIRTIRKAPRSSRWVYYQYIIYLLLMIGSTVYAYFRLDFERSYDKTLKQEMQQKHE